MKKLNKFLITVSLLLCFICLTSCAPGPCPVITTPTLNVSFTKNFFANSFDELDNIIMNTDSYCDADLKFYYNLGFLEKYNWTMSPDFLDSNEYVIYNENTSHAKYDSAYSYSNSHCTYYGNYFETYRENPDDPTLEGYSTPYEFLTQIGTEAYYYKYEESNYKGLSFNSMIYNDRTKKFGYGITYQARSIEPLFLTKDDQTNTEYTDKIESANVKICPNLMIPSLEDVEPDENGFYSVPVVIKEEYENLTIVCRIYIDEYPIDCVIHFKYYSGLNSIDEVKEAISSLNLNEYVKTKNNTNGNQETYTLRFEYDSCENSYPICYNYYVNFSAVHTKYNSNSKFNKPYLCNYIEQLDEYFSTFIDGIEEVNIKYRKK